MIGEYLNIVMMCAMTTILFLGGWHLPWGSVESLHSGFWTGRSRCWSLREDLDHVLHVRDGEGHRAALPLRPADASGLEGVPADLARRRHRRWLRGVAFLAPAATKESLEAAAHVMASSHRKPRRQGALMLDMIGGFPSA
jgi:hypothetical protein